MKKLPQSKIELEIEIPAAELASSYEKAFAEATKELTVEGFRKGHVPLKIAKQHIQEHVVLAQAAERILQSVYEKKIQEEGVEPIGEPDIQVLKLALGNPFVFLW